MKWKTCKYMIAAAVACCMMNTVALAGDKDDPDVMGQIVRGQMAKIDMMPPVDMGTLIFSDSPEYAEQDGILYGDKVEGDVRVYFYHVNQSDIPKKIVVIAYNPGEEEEEVVLQGYQYTRPSQSYYLVGKELSTMYYEGENTVNRIRVAPHGYALIGDRLDGVAVQPDELFSGIVDMTLPSPMYISTMILPVHMDPLVFVRQQRYLPSDDAKLRGTFQGKDRSLRTFLSYRAADGAGYIKIGDGVEDKFLQGRDVMDNRESENVGNYGVDYSIAIRTKGKEPVHLYFNPQGGEYAGVAELLYEGTNGQAGEKKIIPLPREGLSMGLQDPYAIQYLDTFQAGTKVTVHMMPPGAANLPVRLILVPEKELQNAVKTVAHAKKLRHKTETDMSTEEPVQKETHEADVQETEHTM